MVHPFDEALELAGTDSPNRLTGATHPAWANMVGPFGGMTAATLVGAIASHPEALGDPLALTVNYLAPIADGPFELLLNPVRTNRTNQHWIVELCQDGEPKTTATAVFGVHRDTWTDVEAVMPVVPAPEDVERRGQDFPIWLSRFDLRMVEGAPPLTEGEESPSSTTTLWVRDAAGRPLDYPGLAACSDIFFPRIYLRTGRLIPAGTISLTTYFHASRDELAALGDDFLLCTARALRFSRGFFDQSATLWGRDGVLLASSHQLVYFKG
ncbi:acyl-CoA thioesterase [Mycolicibacterium insubricum]|jgi:acyl-CoA thioesterase|uniref:Acyl-CoA thioesterase n=2 Tax=Mycolicibacterium insubricum TaxID=444597 RepID=A0A1X0DGI9_9MYCO|nr:thioesterase family protein [Mycolicibacterium insubricum]ORA71495.1 acyl-CoA thioesterase [Mycolicibacterium insubricum]BBZ67132.1 acyl-CoA thioesterase [Mycolicibacterium insubricum]